MSYHSEVLREGLDPEFVADWRDAESLDAVRLLAADVLDAIPDKDDPLGWVQRQVDKVEMTAALDATGLLRDEYPDQMAARSCTCEPDAVCGAHRLLARYIELNAAFVQRGKERREVQAELRAARAEVERLKAERDDALDQVNLLNDYVTKLRAALGGLSPEATRWAIDIARETIKCRTTDDPAALTWFYRFWDAGTPEVRAQILKQGELT